MTAYTHRNGDLFTDHGGGRLTYLTPQMVADLLTMWNRIAADPTECRTFRRHAAVLAASLQAAVDERDTPRPDHPEDALSEVRAMELA